MSLKYNSGSRAIVTILLPILAVFGVTCNLLFLFVVHQVPKMRTITNLFLVQLAVCDISSLILMALRYLVTYLKSPEYEFVSGTSAGCATFDFLLYFTYFVGVFLICAVSIERYIAICKPLYYHAFKSHSRASKTALVCWIAGFILAIPGLVPFKEITICAVIPSLSPSSATSGNDTWMVFESCIPSCEGCFQSLLVFDTVQFVIVIACNAAMYIAIIKTLHHRPESSRATGIASRSVSRMLVINGVAFFFLLGPYEIWNVVYLIYEHTGILIVSQSAFYWLGYVYRLCSPANNAVNPLIYGASNPRYLEAFLEAFRCSPPTQHPTSRRPVNTASSSV